MFAPRTTTRAARAFRSSGARAAKRGAPKRAFATEKENVSSGGIGPGVAGGLIGGGAVAAGTYLWYHFSGAKTVVQTGQSAKQYADQAAEQFKVQLREITPGPTDNVIDEIRNVAQKYAGWIPGGKEFVDRSFKDLDEIRSKHGDEVNQIARSTYEELREVANKKGTSLDTLNDVWQILSKRLSEISSLAGDAAQQILDNHPEVREKLDGSFDQLRSLGERLGPEAKKSVDETFNEASKIAKQGINSDTPDRLRKLVQDKIEELKRVADQSWSSGWEQIKPLLEKNPEVKKVVEENLDSLKQGHVTDAIDKVRGAVQSGSTGGLERYIKDTKKKAEQFASGGLSNWLNALPNGSQILPQLQKLKEAAETKKPEAEKLGKDTVNDISQILEKRSKEAEELLKK